MLMASGLAASQAHHVCVVALEHSAHSFCQYFQALQQERLNPVERVVFSLALTKAQAQRECKRPMHG
jgi:hypothetical protein